MLELQKYNLISPKEADLTCYSEAQAELLTIVATRRRNLTYKIYEQDYKFSIQAVDQQFAKTLNNYLLLNCRLNGQDFSAYTNQDNLFTILASHFKQAGFADSPYKVWMAAAQAIVEELVISLRTKYGINLQISSLKPTSQGGLTFVPEKGIEQEETILQCLLTSEQFAAEMLLVIPAASAAAFSKLLKRVWAPTPLVSRLASKLQLKLGIVLGHAELPAGYFSFARTQKIELGDVLFLHTGPLTQDQETVWLKLEDKYLACSLQDNQLCIGSPAK